MQLKKLIKEIEHQNRTPTTGDSKIGFYCFREDRRMPEPRPAKKYDDDGMLNYPYEKTPSGEEIRKITPQAKMACQNGWIMAAPVDIKIVNPPDESPHPIQGRKFRDSNPIIYDYTRDDSIPTDEIVFSVNTRWFITVPDGYSVFYTSPANFTETRFSVIPGVVDADEFPLQINVPVIATEEKFVLQSGTPLIQVYPFNRESYNVSASIEVIEE